MDQCGAVRVVPPPDYKPINNIDDLEIKLLTKIDKSKNLFKQSYTKLVSKTAFLKQK